MTLDESNPKAAVIQDLHLSHAGYPMIDKKAPNALATAFNLGWAPQGASDPLPSDEEFLMATIQRELPTGVPFPALSPQVLTKLWNEERVLSVADLQERIVGIEPPAAKVILRALALCHNPFYWIGHAPDVRVSAYLQKDRMLRSAVKRFRQKPGRTIEAFLQAAAYGNLGQFTRWWETAGESMYRELQTRLKFRGADFSELPMLQDATFITLCQQKNLWVANMRLDPARSGLSTRGIRAMEAAGIFSTQDMTNVRFTPRARFLRLVRSQLESGPVTPNPGLWRPPAPPKMAKAAPAKKDAKPAAGVKPVEAKKTPTAHILYAIPGIIIQEMAALPTTANFISRVRQAMFLYARHKWPILQTHLEGPAEALQLQAGYALAIIDPATFMVQRWVDVSATSKDLLIEDVRYAFINVRQAVIDGRVAEPALRHSLVAAAA